MGNWQKSTLWSSIVRTCNINLVDLVERFQSLSETSMALDRHVCSPTGTICAVLKPSMKDQFNNSTRYWTVFYF